MQEKIINLYNDLEIDVIAVRRNDDAKDMPKKSYYIANADNYNVFIRDGKIIGMPRPYGGTIYPNSKDCINPPSLFSPRYKSFSVITVPKITLKFTWDIELIIPSLVSDKAFKIDTPLHFYPIVDLLEVPENMDRFMALYNLARAYKYKLATVAYEEYTVADWKAMMGNEIIDVFNEHFAKYMEELKAAFHNRSSAEDIDVTPFIDSMYKPFNDLFRKYALTLASNFYHDFGNYVRSIVNLIFKTWSEKY